MEEYRSESTNVRVAGKHHGPKRPKLVGLPRNLPSGSRSHPVGELDPCSAFGHVESPQGAWIPCRLFIRLAFVLCFCPPGDNSLASDLSSLFRGEPRSSNLASFRATKLT